jgi:tRNA modification GTPase
MSYTPLFPTTIYALSSGHIPSGVAVIRLSGPKAIEIAQKLSAQDLKPRQAILSVLKDPATNEVIDQALILIFPGPKSFTGEDVAEFHVHGSRAVIAKLFSCFESFGQCVPALSGEFTKRAFSYGKMDLTAVEGLADLIEAETEAQRQQAIFQQQGGFYTILQGWKQDIIKIRARIEADLDFSDEDDVDDLPWYFIHQSIDRLVIETKKHLDDTRGERVRDGFLCVLVGEPNVGKSSLLNTLAKRDVAIVTDEPGTTRDLLEVHLDIGGYPVKLVDTAGLRETSQKIEQEGIRRAKDILSRADLVLSLSSQDNPPAQLAFKDTTKMLSIRTKADIYAYPENGAFLNISVETGEGLDALVKKIEEIIASFQIEKEPALITRERHRQALLAFESALLEARQQSDPVLLAENLRQASFSLAQIAGETGIEDVLDVLFSSFCIGK